MTLRWPALPTAILTLLVLGFASAASGAEPPARPIPVEQWLAGPERQDYPWTVKVEPAALTYQQRFLVRVVAVLKARDLRQPNGEHDFSLVVKMADAGGNWLAGRDEVKFATKPAQIDTLEEFRLAADVLLRPGQYTLAAILYDRVHQNGNLTRLPVLVAPPDRDPLPDLARDLPAADFPPEELSTGIFDTGKAQWPPRRYDAGPYRYEVRPPVEPAGPRSWLNPRESLSLGRGTAWLPVANRRPLVIDLVVNFSSPYSAYSAGGRDAEASPEAYRTNAARMLQVGNVLSQLRTARGCVRVSAVDVSRQKIIAEGLDGGTLDWEKLRQAVLNADIAKVDVRILRDRLRAPAFFRNYVARLAAGHDSCGFSSGQYKRAIIIASAGVVFPEGTDIERLDPAGFSDVSFYQVRLRAIPWADWDQLEAILRPMKPLRVTPSSPLQFRKGVAAIIADMEKATPQ